MLCNKCKEDFKANVRMFEDLKYIYVGFGKFKDKPLRNLKINPIKLHTNLIYDNFKTKRLSKRKDDFSFGEQKP